MSADIGLREQKKRRTRRALVEAALRLFDEKGYDQTTVSEIAAAAEVSYATFFNYFTAKDDVVFADDGLYPNLLHEVFANREPQEQPAELLLRAIRHLTSAAAWSFPLDHELTRLRARLIADVPALRAGALLRNSVLQQHLAAALQEAYPHDVDALHATALTGALVGSVDAVLTLVTASGMPTEEIARAIEESARIALHGYLPPPSDRPR